MKQLHMIGNAHLDLVWMWNWREGYQENLATFYSALERLDEFEDVVFTSSSAQLYEWAEETSPELFRRIQEAVKKGRWVICGGWWVQPDCNLPGGESFARHALIAQNYFYEKFGKISRVGYNVDSFGHNGNIPALLKQSGMDAYVFMRPDHTEKELPGRNFLWEAPDGSTAAVFRIPFQYCTFDGLKEHIERCSQEFDDYSEHCMCFYGVGNHGGGPTIENIHTIHEMQKEAGDAELIFDSPEGYFLKTREEQKNWPIVRGDLLHHASGCYSAVSKIKKTCRMAEQELLRAEKYCVLSELLTDQPYPEDFDRGWKSLLLNQFHDTMAGTAIPSAYQDAWVQLGESRAIAQRNENRALQKLSFGIAVPMEEGMLPVTVFNPQGFEVEQIVEYETGFFSNGTFSERLHIVDSQGREVPYQFIKTEAKAPNRRRIAFPALVPALGYETYRIRFEDCDQETKEAVPILTEKQLDLRKDMILENSCIRLTFEKGSGALCSCYVKETDREYLDGRVEWTVNEDYSDTWAHAVFEFHNECGRFSVDSACLLEDGGVRKILQINSSYHHSTAEQQFILEEGSNTVKVKCRLDWHEQHKCLKIRHPLGLENSKWICQIPFGTAERTGDGKENPMQGFSDITGSKAGEICGMTFLTDSKSSCDYKDGSFFLTVLRSPVYVHHNPYEIGENEQTAYTEQGIQEFMYAIAPHEGQCQKGEMERAAQKLAQPLTLLPQSCHPGVLPETFCGIKYKCSHVILSAFKRSRDGKGYVLRFYETDGAEDKFLLELPGLELELRVEIGPYEILSLYIDSETKTAHKVNFLEWTEYEHSE